MGRKAAREKEADIVKGIEKLGEIRDTKIDGER